MTILIEGDLDTVRTVRDLFDFYTTWALGISYNMVTALITALTIGIGVDYTIHLTHRFLEEERSSRRIRDAMGRAMTTTGGALVASALTTALGLLTLLFAPLTPMRQLGLLTAVTILLALIAAFVVLPPLLVLWPCTTAGAPPSSARRVVITRHRPADRQPLVHRN